MLNYSTGLATAVAAGAGALLFLAPIASAQNPPPPCAPDDQHCQQQQQGAGVANQVIDNVQNGLDQISDGSAPQGSGGPGIMVLKDGVPWCMPLNQPIPPGAVITSLTGDGTSSYC